MAKQILLTKQGLEALQEELDDLKVVKRKEIAEKIKIALSFGDLSENSEYDEAKNDQAKIENRINEAGQFIFTKSKHIVVDNIICKWTQIKMLLTSFKHILILRKKSHKTPSLYYRVVVFSVPLQGHMLHCRGCCGLVHPSYRMTVEKRLQPQPFTVLLIS